MIKSVNAYRALPARDTVALSGQPLSRLWLANKLAVSLAPEYACATTDISLPFTRPWLLKQLVSEPPATHGQSVGPALPLQHLLHGKRQGLVQGATLVRLAQLPLSSTLMRPVLGPCPTGCP